MKKLIIILSFLISSVFAYSQGVKISAMPVWTTSLDSTWFPIIYYNGTNWINYRAQGWQLAKERIDSIINNWPAGGAARFGVSGEDDQATQVRSFDQNGFTFTIHDGSASLAGEGSVIFNSLTQYHQGIRDASNHLADIYVEPVAGILLQTIDYDGSTLSEVSITYDSVSFLVGNLGLHIFNIAEATTSYVLYIDPVTGNTTYGAAPTGGGGAGTSINAANGLSMRNDSTVILGTNPLDMFTTIDVTTAFSLTVSGDVPGATANGSLIVNNNSGTGNALYVTSTGNIAARMTGLNYGLYANSTAASGTGVRGESSGATGTGVVGYGSSTTTTPLQGYSFTSDQNADLTTMVLTRAVSSGGGTDGIGNRLRFNTQTTLLGQTSNDIVSEWTTATSASRVADLVIYGVDNAVLAEKFRIKGGGNVIINTTGKALGIKSPDGTIWYVTVDNSGVLSTSTTAP